MQKILAFALTIVIAGFLLVRGCMMVMDHMAEKGFQLAQKYQIHGILEAPTPSPGEPENPRAQRDSPKDYNYLNITMEPSTCLDRRIPLEAGEYTFTMHASEQCVVNLQPHYYAMLDVSTAPEGYIWTGDMSFVRDRVFRYANANGNKAPTRRFVAETAATKDRPFPAPDAHCGAVIARTEKADWTFLGTDHRRFLGGNEGTGVTFAINSPDPENAYHNVEFTVTVAQ